MIIAGIDYSLTSPAICIHSGTSWKYENCSFYFLVKKEKSLLQSHPFYSTLYPEYSCDEERFEVLSSWSMDKIKDTEQCYIEGYSFGSVGRVFQIAENAGLLKYKIWNKKIPFGVIPPTVIKKFATGKGNANKQKMYESFLDETGVDIFKKLDIMNHNQWNPVSDIIDSYYIAKHGFFTMETQNADQT